MTHSTVAGVESPFRHLTLGAHPSVTPRLLRSGADVEDAAAYRSTGGYGPGPAPADLLDAVERAGLRGRGGAAFPAAVKLRAVAAGEGPRHVVANGEEGEPASAKDRWLLRHRPHLVLDGLFRAAAMVDAAGAFVYVSDPVAADAVGAALAELAEVPVPVTVHRVERGYVAGEETAVVRALDGGPAKPLDKPPRPFETGVQGRPTLVSNVETLASIALLAAGAPDAATFLMTISGACERPGVYEVPYGAPLGDTVDALAGAAPDARGFLMGGYFAGVAGPRARAFPLDPDRLRAEESGLGCGAVVVLGPDDCAVAAAADVMSFFSRENAEQCGACIRGTAGMAGVLVALSAGTTTPEQVERLRGWSTSLRGRGACGTLDGATFLAASLLDEFPDEVDAHLAGPCPRCAARPVDADRTRFAVSLEPVTTTTGGPQ